MTKNNCNKSTDTITVLSCHSPNAKLTKEFTAAPDGVISKQAYGAGKYFTYEEKPVSGLADIQVLLAELQQHPLKCIIRGKPKQGAGAVVPRKLHGDDAAFEAQPRYWVMLDFDKVECPAYLNPLVAPDAAAEWVKQSLPHPFNTASCIYKFSSSQSVPKKIGGDVADTVSVHFVFWLNRPVAETELKAFFKMHPCGVDPALFSAVQVHYTASPIFLNMTDPLPKRIGMLKGSLETVVIPIIPAATAKKSAQIKQVTEAVPQSNQDAAIDLLLQFYPKEGGRDRFCGAIAGMLARGGWMPESVAEFIMVLAEAAGDTESMKRYDTALRRRPSNHFD